MQAQRGAPHWRLGVKPASISNR